MIGVSRLSAECRSHTRAARAQAWRDAHHVAGSGASPQRGGAPYRVFEVAYKDAFKNVVLKLKKKLSNVWSVLAIALC